MWSLYTAITSPPLNSILRSVNINCEQRWRWYRTYSYHQNKKAPVVIQTPSRIPISFGSRLIEPIIKFDDRHMQIVKSSIVLVSPNGRIISRIVSAQLLPTIKFDIVILSTERNAVR